MRYFWIYSIALIFLSCSSTSHNEETRKIPDFSEKSRISVYYQVYNKDQFLGFVDQYEWKNEKGVSQNYHMVYNAFRHLIGQIRWDGNTLEYKQDGSSTSLGNFPLEKGLEKLFDVDKITLLVAHQDKLYSEKK